MPKISFKPGPVASAFIKAVMNGEGDEILALGPRGEAKTISTLIAMASHAKMHEQAGFTLPVPWIGITDTFNNHKEKTHESLKKPFWQGAWSLYNDGHRAVFKTNKAAVVISLFGIENRGAMDRARRETACTWAEEVAPTTEGAGVPEDAIDMSITSQRVPTHAAVTVFSSNYPERGHWLWSRFKPLVGKYGLNVHPADSRKLTFQIPKGDNAFITDAQRAKWYERLKDRPELVARLLEGKPAAIYRGRPVAIAFLERPGAQPQAIGFNESRHVATKRLRPVEGIPIRIGQDGGHTPCSIIGQEVNGVIRILAALSIKHGGMRQQYEYNVKPWLRENAVWALNRRELLLGCYDPSIPDDESDSDRNPIDVIEELVGGIWDPGPVDWESRKGALFKAFNYSVGGDPGLLIDAVDADELIQALAGQWYYPTNRFDVISRDKPKQPNHPWDDLGQSFCYFLCRVFPDYVREKKPVVVDSAFDARESMGAPQVNVDTSFSL